MDQQKMIINIGSHVVLNLLDRTGKKDRLEFDIVADTSADFPQGFLGVGTPLAKELMGEKAGNTIPYLQDDILAIEILEVSHSTVEPPVDIQEKRLSMMNKAIRDVEHTNAVVFASSFSGKWGDYDPDSLPIDENQEDDASEE
jgi:hypothetical protein